MSIEKILFAAKVIGGIAVFIALVYVAFRKPPKDNSTGDYRDEI